MNKYLLLRNNKQSGPYTIDDIKALGVKSYDLIWVEGRSAAWRYPGEIDEFKSFAPQVEEQPYDRFFKKSSSENKVSRQGADNQATEEKPRLTEENKPRVAAAEESAAAWETESRTSPIYGTTDNKPVNSSGSSQKSIEKETKRPKYVSVSMPSGMQKMVMPKANDDREIKVPVKNNSTEYSPSAPVSPPVFPERKIPKEKINEKSPAEHQAPGFPLQQNRILGNILQTLAIAAGVVSLLALGILIGMGIGPSKSSDPKPALKEVSGEMAVAKDNNIPVEILTRDVIPAQNDSLTTPTVLQQKEKVKKPAAKPNLSVVPPPVETIVLPEPVAQTPEETIKVSDARENARQNIAKLISVKTNDYKVGMFGGIDDVKVTVHNSSDYPVDLVVVDVTYIQSNKKSYKVESLHFNDIAANSSLTLEAPKTNKGIKIKTSLTHISSKTLGVSENIW
jgi:hypothetical protein